MHFTYKSLQKEDLAFVERLFKHPTYQPFFFEGNTTPEQWKRRYEEIKMFQVIYKGKEAIGILNVVSKVDVIDIALLAFCFDKTNQGYGTLVLHDIESSHPYKRITVSTMKKNIKAIDFYRNNGFVKIGEKLEDYEENGIHEYILFEAIQSIPYEDRYYDDFLKLQVGLQNKDFVSSPENILYKHVKDKENTRLYLFKLQNKVIGCLLLKHNKEFQNFFIWQFIIDEESQNKGIGSCIIRRLIKDIHQKYDNYDITTTVLNNNTVSKKLFTKLGFIIHSYETDLAEINYILKGMKGEHDGY